MAMPIQAWGVPGGVMSGIDQLTQAMTNLPSNIQESKLKQQQIHLSQLESAFKFGISPSIKDPELIGAAMEGLQQRTAIRNEMAARASMWKESGEARESRAATAHQQTVDAAMEAVGTKGMPPDEAYMRAMGTPYDPKNALPQEKALYGQLMESHGHFLQEKSKSDAVQTAKEIGDSLKRFNSIAARKVEDTKNSPTKTHTTTTSTDPITGTTSTRIDDKEGTEQQKIMRAMNPQELGQAYSDEGFIEVCIQKRRLGEESPLYQSVKKDYNQMVGGAKDSAGRPLPGFDDDPRNAIPVSPFAKEAPTGPAAAMMGGNPFMNTPAPAYGVSPAAAMGGQPAMPPAPQGAAPVGAAMSGQQPVQQSIPQPPPMPGGLNPQAAAIMQALSQPPGQGD